jgi:hypothetical protein
VLDEEKVRIKISGLINEDSKVDFDKYSNFEEMVKDYINITQGVLTKIKINEKEIPLAYYDEIKDAFSGVEEANLFKAFIPITPSVLAIALICSSVKFLSMLTILLQFECEAIIGLVVNLITSQNPLSLR